MRKRRCKANTKLVPAMCTDQIAPLNLPKPSSEVTKAAVATQTLIRAHHSPAQSQSLSIQQTQGSDLQNRESKEIVCDDAQDLKGIDSAEDKESDDKTDGDDQNEADQDSDEDKESEDKTDSDDQNEADQAEWTHVSRRKRRKVNLPYHNVGSCVSLLIYELACTHPVNLPQALAQVKWKMTLIQLP